MMKQSASLSLKQNNRYVQWLSMSKLVLFGGRLMLSHNRTLYPYHKWFLRVLAGVKEKPADLLVIINRLYEAATADNARDYYEAVKNFRDWGLAPSSWPTQFIRDVELSWQRDFVPIDDL